MSSENLHALCERLSQQALDLYFAIVSLMEVLNGSPQCDRLVSPARRQCRRRQPSPDKAGAVGRQQKPASL